MAHDPRQQQWGQPPAPQGWQQPGYGPPQQVHYVVTPPSAGTNGLAIASLVLGILWLYWVGSILAIIFGHIALSQLKRKHQDGKGLAVAGLVLGYIGLAVLVVVVIAVIGVSNSSGY